MLHLPLDGDVDWQISAEVPGPHPRVTTTKWLHSDPSCVWDPADNFYQRGGLLSSITVPQQRHRSCLNTSTPFRCLTEHGLQHRPNTDPQGGWFKLAFSWGPTPHPRSLPRSGLSREDVHWLGTVSGDSTSNGFSSQLLSGDLYWFF